MLTLCSLGVYFYCNSLESEIESHTAKLKGSLWLFVQQKTLFLSVQQVENELILMSNIIKVLFCIAMKLQLKYKLLVSNLIAFV